MIEIIKNWFSERKFGMARSHLWNEVRHDFIKENSVCSVCNTNQNLEVHHIQPFHLNPELELKKENLITLCRPDHYLFGHLNNWSSFNPSVVTDSKIWRVKIKQRI